MSLATNVSDLATRIATESKSLRTLLNGNALDLSELDTTAKTNLVAAINEVLDVAETAAGGGVTINDAATNTTNAWSSQKIRDEIDAVVGGAPGALDTLNELAAAIGDDANYAASITTALALKAPLASPALTGTPTAPTATGGTNNTQVATTAFVTSAVTAAAVPAASETVAGRLEIATTAEITTGTDNTRAVSPAGLAATVGNTATDFVATFEAGLA